MSWWPRLKCRLGFHKWCYTLRRIPDTAYRACLRCGKQQ